MYSMVDIYNDPVLYFDGGKILNRSRLRVGSVENGIVQDINGSPTRVAIEGDDIVWHGVNPGPVVRVYGIVIYDLGNKIPAGVVLDASSDDERRIAAAAYWEFILSTT